MSAASEVHLSEDGLRQFVTPEGVPTVAIDALGVDRAGLRDLYRDMVLSRRIDTEAISLQRQGELAMWPSMRGQEGVQVGVAHAIDPGDMVFPTYREHAVSWCLGVDPVGLLSLFRGTTLGGWDARRHGFNTYTLVIGAQTLHACGYAMGVVRDVERGLIESASAVVAFLGDGALSEGETNEAFVWAATMTLPVVFVVQNNQWAISSPFETQSKVPAACRAGGFGIPAVRVDGNDVVACLSVARDALACARAGEGPTLIEALTYRMNPHTTADDASRYRTSEDEQTWQRRDPIERVARLRAGIECDVGDDEAAIVAESDALAERIREGCRQLPEPAVADSIRSTYAEPPPELRRQLQSVAAWEGAR